MNDLYTSQRKQLIEETRAEIEAEEKAKQVVPARWFKQTQFLLILVTAMLAVACGIIFLWVIGFVSFIIQ